LERDPGEISQARERVKRSSAGRCILVSNQPEGKSDTVSSALKRISEKPGRVEWRITPSEAAFFEMDQDRAGLPSTRPSAG